MKSRPCPKTKKWQNSHLRNQGPLMEVSNIIKVVAVFFSDVASAEKNEHKFQQLLLWKLTWSVRNREGSCWKAMMTNPIKSAAMQFMKSTFRMAQHCVWVEYSNISYNTPPVLLNENEINNGEIPELQKSSFSLEEGPHLARYFDIFNIKEYQKISKIYSSWGRGFT